MQVIKNFYSKIPQIVKYIFSRMLRTLIITIIVMFATFSILQFAPKAEVCNQKMSIESCELVREQKGYYKTGVERFTTFFTHDITHGLGQSNKQTDANITNWTLISSSFLKSLSIAIPPIFFGVFFGVIGGIISAIYRNKWPDRVLNASIVVFSALPSVISVYIFQIFFTSTLPVFPSTANNEYFWFESFIDMQSYMLPMIAIMVLWIIPTVIRYIRAELIEVLNSDYMLLARAKGLSRKQAIIRHGLRNSLIPLLTVLGPLAAGIVAGSFIVENVFNISTGLGSLAIAAIGEKDVPLIAAVTFVITIYGSFSILLIDILYGIVDPRIRVSGGRS